MADARSYKGEKTKELIVMAALELFAKDGFDLVSMQKIGDKVGISQAAVAQYFGTKRNLIMSVRSHVTQSNYGFVDTAIDPYSKSYEQLYVHCYRNIEWAFKNPGMTQILLLTYYFSFNDNVFREHQNKTVETATLRIEKYVIGHSHEVATLPKNKIRNISEEIHRWLLGYFLRDVSISNSHSFKSKKVSESVHLFLKKILLK
ncbi:MAG: TetR/AcrR family transcriptional regulator [Bdellovibrionaceae bacterium]|nr:TetR/AcrR family transcriptional regulator [Pseudobdellovibrionaceae bacterium]